MISALPAGEFGLFDGDASTVFYEVQSLPFLTAEVLCTFVAKNSPVSGTVDTLIHHCAQVQTVLSNHIVSIVPAAAIGMVCGGLSIAFTVLNLKAARLRQKIVGVGLLLLQYTLHSPDLVAAVVSLCWLFCHAAYTQRTGQSEGH
jgi:Voltage gated chloride channel